MQHDEFGDRMKLYEGIEAKKRFNPDLPLVARLDGRTFSKFTRGFKKPFDDTLTRAMDQTTKALVEETKAAIGYTQSDEITLVWDAVEGNSQRFFGDRIQKLCSVLASKCTIEFAFAMMEQLNARGDYRVQTRKPHFDCRVWNVPDQGEAANTLLWRSQDARRNGISVFCQQHVSHKALQGADQARMLELAYENGAPDINAACTSGELFGRYFKRVTRERELTEDVLLRIPEDKRPEPGETFLRSSVEQIDIDYFGHVGDQEARIAVIFE